MWYTWAFVPPRKRLYLCGMFLTKVKKYRTGTEGRIEAYHYYRLTQSYRNHLGKDCKHHVLCLGELAALSECERKELAALLSSMIEKGHPIMTENRHIYDLALDYYNKYKQTHYSVEGKGQLAEDAARREQEAIDDMVSIKLSSLVNRQVRTIGPEAICRSTLKMLDLRGFLESKGWSRDEIELALMQIISRALYPYSELKTSRYLRENSALAEMFKIKKEKITKDALYGSALRLWNVHREMEDWLHKRVCSVFRLEEKILLFDITNTYFEGRMAESEICRRGRSKERRDDCKIVVLAAVVNTDGLIVRTSIYEGNRQDVTTMKEVIGSLDLPDSGNQPRKIVVMDAGFYSADNIAWLKENDYDYITVLRSGNTKFIAGENGVVKHRDCRGQEIRLQAGTVEINADTYHALQVDSDAKAMKEQAMYEQARKRYEQGLEAIKNGLLSKGGTKKRDAVNKRIGRLNQKYPTVHRDFTISIEYEGKGKNEKAVGMSWTGNQLRENRSRKFHGKYVLITSLDEKDEVNVWKFYNVIRTVEETFHTLKTDLDIRPVYHKKDKGIKAHLNLAILGFWIVSVTRYRLKLKHYHNLRWDEIIRIASTQVVITTEMQTTDGDMVRVRQSSLAENNLAEIYQLLDIGPNPIGKVKSVVPLKRHRENAPPDHQ